MTKVCKRCGTDFQTSYRGQLLYCTNRCARRAASKANYDRQDRVVARAYKQKHHRERRWKAILYLGGKCVDCGEADPIVLQFDHVPERGIKTSHLSQMFGHSYCWETITNELAKCDLVCANCHMRRSVKRGQFQRARVDNATKT